MSNRWKRKGQNEGRWQRDPAAIIDVSHRQQREPAKFALIDVPPRHAKTQGLREVWERVERERQEYMQTEAFWREVWST